MASNHMDSSDLSTPLLNSTNSIHEAIQQTPLAKAGFLSRATFTWMEPLIRTGNIRPLELKDVPQILPEDKAEAALKGFTDAWDSQKKKDQSRERSSFRALGQYFWKDALRTGVFAFLKATGSSAGPIFIYFFVDYTSGNQTFKYEGIMLTICLLAVKLMENFAQRQWYFGCRRLGMKVQSALTAAIYWKELRLSNKGRRKHSTGEIVNYIAVDGFRISELIWWMHWIWMTPYQIIVAMCTLFIVVGWAALPGLILVILFILLNTPLALSMQKSQGKFMVAQDERLRSTSEILNGMKVIKLQAWEEKFEAFIERMRETEFTWLKSTQSKKNYATVMYWLMPTVVTAVVLVTCILIKLTLTATIVFTVLATFRIIQDPIRMIPDVLSSIIQSHVSFSRLDVFLQEEELPRDAVIRESWNAAEYTIRVDSAVLAWDPEDPKATLRDINMVVKRGEKVAVCGAIGSGKSTLIYAILGEIPKLSGTVHLSGRVAYVAQTAWIQSGTVRDNILFGMPMDEARYTNVVRACALEQDMQAFSHGDLTEIGERGINMSGGQKQRIQLARAVYNDADIYLLDDPFSAVDAQTAAVLFHDCVLGALKNKTVVLVTHQVEFLPVVDTILVMQDGQIKQAGTYEQLLTAGDAFQQLVSAHQEALHSVSHQEENGEQEISTSDSHQPSTTTLKRRMSKEKITSHQERKEEHSTDATQLVQEEEKETGDAGLKPYLDYINIARGRLTMLGVLINQTAFTAAQLYGNIWLAMEISSSSVSSGLLVGVYSAASAACVGFFYLRTLLVSELGLEASKAFFRGLMSSIMKAPMSFFDSTPSGRILNRASVDMSVLDLDISFGLSNVIALAFDIVGILIVMAIATWEILIVAIPILLLVQYFQRCYMAAARELSRINSIAKAPILNSASETNSGVVTIRAFVMEERFKRRNLQLIDTDANVYFHKHAALEWLVVRIELSCSVIVTISAVLIVLQIGTTVTAGFAGLAITFALALNNCQIFLSWWQGTSANNIVSEERIKQYMELPKEAPAIIETNRPPPQWPTKGRIDLENLQVRYRENAPLVLKGITCTIRGGHKIGVVGRTGSGKTTLISALFRLVEPVGGRICIDGIDIGSIGLHDLRFKLSIIPQEPVLFRGTVRGNLDPLNQYTDFDIWESLERCQLGKLIRALPLQLDSEVTDQGENWSTGQRQLFCLGRVLLKRSQVLVLDEATASIDSATDALLQKVIREEFSACTVVTVAHRIPTVIDSDMVMALRDGFLIDYDSPSKLMDNKNSLFAKLVAEYWAQAGRASRQDLNSAYLQD